MLTPQSCVVRSTTALTAEIDGELVMMDGPSGSYFNLDVIGADIWNRIAAPVEVEQLCAALSERYDADLDTIRRDVLVLFNDMVEKRLVTEAG